MLDRTPSIPEDCQWVTFLRNHDELSLEMVTPHERQWMWNYVCMGRSTFAISLMLTLTASPASMLLSHECELIWGYDVASPRLFVVANSHPGVPVS